MVTFILATSGPAGHLKSFLYNKRLRRIDGRREESQNLPDKNPVFWGRGFCEQKVVILNFLL
jgi:hypothetical protein